MDLDNDIFETDDNPLTFISKAFPWKQEGGILESRELEKWQHNFLKTLGSNIQKQTDKNNYIIRMSTSSGQGVGKTALFGMLILWFLSTHKNPQVVVTANTENQLKNVVWRELSKWHNLCINKHWFEWTATSFYLKENPPSWKAVAIPYNEGRPEAFQGIHADDVLIIFDEASGIPEVIWDVVNGTLNSGRCIFLAFSNPTKNRGSFRETFGIKSSRWINFRVDLREVSFSNKEEIKKDIEYWGEDSDYVRVRIKGDFPKAGDKQFIPSDIIEQCFEYEERFYHDFKVIIGVDVARSLTGDESVICIRQGRKIHGFRRFRGLKGKELAQRVIEDAKRWNTQTIFVDGVGVGSSPYDFLQHFGYNAVDVQSGLEADDKLTYLNKRCEMWGRMKLAMMEKVDFPKGEDDFTRDTAKRLKEQLESMEYEFTDKGQIRLSRVADLKKAGFSSPDIPTALALTYAYRINILKSNDLGNSIKRISDSNLFKI